MLFYWGLWVFFFILSLLGGNRWGGRCKYNYAFLYVCICLIAVLVGGREYVGADWSNYEYFYNYGYVLIDQRDSLEFVFQFIRDTLKNWGFSYGFFSFIISLLSLTALYKAIKLSEINNCWLAFLVYLSMFFCHYQLNVIRHGTLASFVLLGYMYRAKGNNLKGLLCLLIGIGFHKIGFVFLLFYPFITKAINNIVLWVALGLGLSFFFIGFTSVFESTLSLVTAYLDLEGYLNADRWGSVGISIGLIGKLFIYLYAFFKRRDLYESNTVFRVALNLLLVSIVLNLALAQNAVIVERMVNAFSMSLVIIIPYLLKDKKGTYGIFLKGVFFLYLLMYYPLVWSRKEAEMLPFVTDITNLFY